MGRRGLEQCLVLILSVDFVGRCDYFKSRHADLKIELVTDYVLATNVFCKAQFKRCFEIVVSDHMWYGLISALSKLVLVETQLDYSIFFADTQALAEYLPQLIFWKEEQFYHLA